MKTKGNLFASWTKALSVFITKFIAQRDSDEVIENFQRHDDGFVITVSKVQYFAFSENIAIVLNMELDEFNQYVDCLDEYEIYQMLDEHWNHDEATEQFISDIREIVGLSVRSCILKESHKVFVDEFASEQKKIFSLYERVDQDALSVFPVDNYHFLPDENHLSQDFAEFRVSYVAQSK